MIKAIILEFDQEVFFGGFGADRMLCDGKFGAGFLGG